MNKFFKKTMNKSQTAIVSPSGNFYGSEQVLFDFLKTCKIQYTVYVPVSSTFEDKLKKQKKHRVKSFNPKNLKLLYFKLVYHIFLKKISNIYVNEGGHIRYLRFLALIFPNRDFILHLRMVYDATANRIGAKLPDNLKLITISKYVSTFLPFHLPHEIIYDPYDFSTSSNLKNHIIKEPLKIGIIGRISITKGLREIENLINYLEKENNRLFQFHFFGHISNIEEVLQIVHRLKTLKRIKIVFHGFTKKDKIYSNIDIILHACQEEGLGRIYLEAIYNNLPLVGFNSGGIKELGNIFGLQSLLIEFDENNNWIPQMVDKLKQISNSYTETSKKIQQAKNKKGYLFNIHTYVQKIEEKINS